MPSGFVRARQEVSPGNEATTPSYKTKVLFPPAIRFKPTPGTSHLQRDDELRGLNESVPVVPESYAPTWEIECRTYPDSIAFFLAAILGAPSTSAGDGSEVKDLGDNVIPTGAYRHRWSSPFGGTGSVPATLSYDVAYKDQSVFYAMRGAAVAELQITTPEEGGSQFTANGPALYLDKQSDPSLTPSYESLSIHPFKRGGLKLLDNLSNMPTVEDFNVSIAAPVEASRSLGVASKWPDSMEKSDDGPVQVTGEMPARLIATSVIDALRDAEGFKLTAGWESDSVITGTYPYKMFVQAGNAQFTEGEPDDLTNARRLGHSLTWRASSPTSGATIIEVVNATASYTATT